MTTSVYDSASISKSSASPTWVDKGCSAQMENCPLFPSSPGPGAGDDGTPLEYHPYWGRQTSLSLPCQASRFSGSRMLRGCLAGIVGGHQWEIQLKPRCLGREIALKVRDMGPPIIEKVGIAYIMALKLQKTICSYSLGDGRYSLLGQPLQYNLSICPPLLHSQSTYTVHQVRVSTISLRTIRTTSFSQLGAYLYAYRVSRDPPICSS